MANSSGTNLFDARYRWQIIASMTVHIMTFMHGVSVGWLAPSLRLLTSDNTPLDVPITIEEASWTGSLIGLGALCGNIIFGLLVDRIGRKYSMYLLAFPNMTYWILIYLARNVVYLYVGRFLTGISGGGCYVVLPIFISEIVDNNIRGALSSMVMLYVSMGMLVGFALASYLSYYLMPTIVVVVPIIYLLAIYELRETPNYLLKRGRDRQAEESYYFYKNLIRGSKEPAVLDAAAKEFEQFRQQALQSGVAEKPTIHDFLNRNTLKIFGLIFVLIIGNQLSACFAIFNYSTMIFEGMGNQLDMSSSTVILGVCQLVGTLCTILLVDHFGRRVLLLTSIFGMGMGELALGLLKDLSTEEFRATYYWLPLVIMCLVVFMAACGFIPLVFTIVIELLPIKIRSIGTSVSMVTLSAFIFVALKLYPLMLDVWGVAATMYISCGSCIFTFTVLGLFLPETKAPRPPTS